MNAMIQRLVSEGTMPARFPRAEAIADGLLVDLTVCARRVGFKNPVAIEAEGYECAVKWVAPGADLQMRHAMEAARLWLLLGMARMAAQHGKGVQSHRFYVVDLIGRSARIGLDLVLERGDRGEPVLTIRLAGK